MLVGQKGNVMCNLMWSKGRVVAGKGKGSEKMEEKRKHSWRLAEKA